jgi:hypothetical protein
MLYIADADILPTDTAIWDLSFDTLIVINSATYDHIDWNL